MVQHKEKFLSLDRKKQRLDGFFFHSMEVEGKYPDLALLMKIVLTLSHGQASVERGFNDNLVLKLIAQRLIKNYMPANSLKLHTITVNQKLERSVEASWGRYNQLFWKSLGKPKFKSPTNPAVCSISIYMSNKMTSKIVK